MAMADTLRQCDPLPSIKPTIYSLDIKTENSYSQRQTISSSLNMPAPPLISPSNIYSGPPPPYSYPSSTTSSVHGGHGGYITPVEARKTEEEKEPATAHRQSLPSIQEALGSGNEAPLSITSLLSKPSPLQIQDSNHNQSPTNTIARPYPETSRGLPHTLAQQSPTSYNIRDCLDKRTQYSPRASTDSAPSRYPASNSHETHYTSIQPSRTVTSPTNPMRPTSQTIPPTQQLSPVYDRAPRGPPPITSPYPHNHFPASYPYPPSMGSVSSYQNLQPTSWRSGGEVDRAEEVRRSAGKPSPRPQYGESVKRHLEAFDLETSLNEISKNSQLASDFARNYGIRAHQDARSGMTTDSLPTIEECTEMIRRQTEVLDCMNRIKDVINAQQQEAMKQRLNQEQRYNVSSEYEDEIIGPYDKLEGAGGFAGADPKKRRGRAAPPGRCHSCNRAETPEWRRGPDGARTLCNACGLHYAKLTRKMGKPPQNGSNIRPKEMRQGSP